MKKKIEDHPRVCGEQCIDTGMVFGSSGSPPRVRGTVFSTAANRRKGRITPACAGNRVS